MYLPSGFGLALASLLPLVAAVPENRSCHEDAAPLLQAGPQSGAATGSIDPTWMALPRALEP